MADVPFLGCKISLISKCDIRYEGILYSVDAKESTIALSKVKSYGTETRGDPSHFVAPKNDIYDIIIFRASDVKDLRVDAHEPPGLSDPAIISVNNRKYPGQTPSTSSFINNLNSSSSNNSTNATVNTGAPTLNSNGSLLSSGPSNQQKQQHQKPFLPFLPTGSQDQHQPQQQKSQQTTQRRNRPEQRPEQRPDQRQDHRPEQRPNRPEQRPNRSEQRPNRSEQRPNRSEQRPNRSEQRPNRPDQREKRSDGSRRDGRIRYDNGNNNYNSRASGGMPMYRRGPPQGGRDRTGAPRGPRKGVPLKFEGEYDFDEANKIFLELEGKLKNMKVKDDEKEQGAESTGETRQSASGSGYDTDDKEEDGCEESGEFYDKAKSFFDKISCESSHKIQGKDWRKERQLNTETFGFSVSYRRGGYRGRNHVRR